MIDLIKKPLTYRIDLVKKPLMYHVVKANFSTMDITEGNKYKVIDSKPMSERHDGTKIIAVKVKDDNNCTYWACLGNEFTLAGYIVA